MILNDVGAQYDGLITDVSRGWPCNGHFSERQRTLYECALATYVGVGCHYKSA